MSKKQKLLSEQAWQRGFSALKKFKRRKGHCRVPRPHLEGNYKLGQWVAVQRYSKDSLAAERRTRLNQLGFIWSRRDWLWERGFSALKVFKAREGHCHVPALHIEEQTLWVDMTIATGFLRKRFSTIALLDRPHGITINSHDPLFERFEQRWIFQSAVEGGTNIEYQVDFKFRSGLLQRLIGPSFSDRSTVMVKAFSLRARRIYGAP